MRQEQKMVWAAVFGAARAEYGLIEAVKIAGLDVMSLSVQQDKIANTYGEDSEVTKFAQIMGADFAKWEDLREAKGDDQQ
jgi:hypothetical protein